MINVQLRDKHLLRNRDYLLNLFSQCVREDVTIFRIEHDKDKHGPYVTEDYMKWRDQPHSDLNGHPLSTRDPLFQICLFDNMKRLPKNHDEPSFHTSLFEQINLISREDADHILFGFESMEQLGNWFSKEEVAKILKMGYSIKEYKVKKAFVSGHQAFFFSSDSTWTR